jgi:CTP:molybdopterin cytidylyltransferase MocA
MSTDAREQALTAIVLAGQRSDQIDPLAKDAGVSHKFMVPIAGKPLLEHVLHALAGVSSLSRIRISVEAEAVAEARLIPGASGEFGIPVDFVPAAPNLADSVHAAAAGVEGQLLITTADNVNLTAEAVEQVLKPLAAGSDATVGLTTRDAVMEVRGIDKSAPIAARIGPYKFSDGAYSNCNLYALADARSLRLAETFREGGQFSKRRRRLLRMVGILNALLYALRAMSLDRAMRRLSRRLGFTVTPVILPDGAQAVDVDNRPSYIAAEAILLKRRATG